MNFFRDGKRRFSAAERTNASPHVGGVIHIAELAAQAAARNAEPCADATPAQPRSAFQLQSEVRYAARRRAVRLVRSAFQSVSFGELACVIDVQPQHVSLALSDEPTKPFAAEHFALVAERRPALGAEVVKAYVTLLPPDAVEALGHDLITLAREMRAKGVRA